MEWPLSRTFEYFAFLKEWYKIRYGDPEEMEDMDMGYDMDDMDIDMPKMPKGSMKGMPKKARKYAKMSNMGSRRFAGKSRAGRGASKHTYKFK